MFLKNYYKTMVAYVTNKRLYFKNVNGEETKLISTAENLITRFGYDNNGLSCPSMYVIRQNYTTSANGGTGGVIFGTGSTPPSIDDYCLSGEIVTGFNWTANVNKTESDSGVSVKAIYTITNTISESITIREVALMSALHGAYNGAAYCGLIERTVLDNPVTIPAGGVGQVVYTITFNYPTAT